MLKNNSIFVSDNNGEDIYFTFSKPNIELKKLLEIIYEEIFKSMKNKKKRKIIEYISFLFFFNYTTIIFWRN